MQSFSTKPIAGIDRRAYKRFTVDCEARLKLPGGERPGSLSDLSESGARFETEKPPVAGATGRLLWADQDRSCRVMWSSDGRCGIQFDQPITTDVVARITRVDATDSRQPDWSPGGRTGSLRPLVSGSMPKGG